MRKTTWKAFEDHGIAWIPIIAEGGTVDSWATTTPKNLEIPTPAGLYDVATNDEALIATIAEKTLRCRNGDR
jgi:hypothetical protein